jgi:NtrC-family two-component system sensor histidine kinase KinB
MDSLRRKLAFSYGILTVVLLAASSVGIYHFVRLGRAIDVILVNNYKSIIAAENMKEALERQDSSALFLVAGRADEGRKQFAGARDAFSAQLVIAANNITEPGEAQIVADINRKYSAYGVKLDQLLNGPASGDGAGRSSYYFDRLEPDFISLKASLDDLLHVNQDAMVAASARATRDSRRAAVYTAIAAALGLAFAVIFAWRFTAYVVDPIATLTQNAKRIAEGDYDQYIDIKSKDEIGVLATEFNQMASRLRDVHKSDYWRLLLERKKSDAVINSIFEPVIVTDAGGNVTKINRAAVQLFGLNRSENGGEANLTLASFECGEQILAAVRDAMAMQRPVSTEDQGTLAPVKVGAADHSFRLRTTPMRDEDGRLLGAVTVLEDVTPTMEVDQLKSGFVSVASGKLRDPLHSLRLALHTLAEGYAGDVSDEQKDLLDVARRSAEQLDDMTSDLLELAELESGARQLSVEPLRPIDMARPAIERHRPAADCKHITLVNKIWSDLPRVNADKEAMRRVFDNLLSNAIRHTGRDGEVSVEAWERNNRVFFSVRDTGEGIPEEYLPNIFGRFIQVKGRTGGGTGLGLALVKRLVEGQQGQISVESKEGEGTAFNFALPLADIAKPLRLEKGA